MAEQKLEARRVDMLYPRGDKLAELRKQTGLSQARLAEQINCSFGCEMVSQEKISRWERSFEFEIDLEMFQVLQQVLSPGSISF
jgi:transcriptional regulator with XRE-family HTH domain